MNTPHWLSHEELRAWVDFAAVLQLLPPKLDAQLEHDAQLTHFEYFVLSALSEAPDRTRRMTALAAHTNATLPRLSRVVSNLEFAGYVSRLPCTEDRRATNVTLTRIGLEKLVATAPGHVDLVRRVVLDALSDEEIAQLSKISSKILGKLDPKTEFAATTRSRLAATAPKSH